MAAAACAKFAVSGTATSVAYIVTVVAHAARTFEPAATAYEKGHSIFTQKDVSLALDIAHVIK